MTRQPTRLLSALLLLCLTGTVAGAATEQDAKDAKATATTAKTAADDVCSLATAVVADATLRYYAHYNEFEAKCSPQEWQDLNAALFAAWNYQSLGESQYGSAYADFSAAGTFLAAESWDRAVWSYHWSEKGYTGDPPAPQTVGFSGCVVIYTQAGGYAAQAAAIMDLYVP